MANELHDYYQSHANCDYDLQVAKKAFSNKHITEEQYDQLEKTLGLMYIHCPVNMKSTVGSLKDEAAVRRSYFPFAKS